MRSNQRVDYHGLYRFLPVLYVLNSVTSPFRRPMDNLLAKVRRRFTLPYLDDVVTFSRSIEEHLNHVLTVWGLLSRVNISLKLEKASLSRAASVLSVA